MEFANISTCPNVRYTHAHRHTQKKLTEHPVGAVSLLKGAYFHGSKVSGSLDSVRICAIKLDKELKKFRRFKVSLWKHLGITQTHTRTHWDIWIHTYVM